MSQVTVNEFRMDKNPGGRMHDDFNGLANKDIYAENFTDEDTGAPVFVRVKFLEYMEIGEDAGINRDATDEDGDGKPDRKATPLLEGADINDTSTWFLHKPDPDPDAPVDPDAPAAVKDPFHEYWKWDQDGSTIYMPTFNKNKDSITPEVNGTYVGADDDFETGRPYDDYVTYADGKTVTADAYYDVDGDDIDENYGKDGDQEFSGIPGAGGDPLTDDATDPDYEVKEEEHTAHATLNSLGVMTMKEWKAANGPICNKWIWDSDGWFYWPQLIQPQTATGLLLDKVTQVKTPSEKCYYAIDMVGQFVSADGDWGDPDPATGFYVDGFTDDAREMLEKAAAVVFEGGKRYIPLGQNIFQEILNDEGEFGAPICGGEDKTPGTDDDRTDVLYVEDGVTVGGKSYGKYFLKPRTDPDEPYYRAVGGDDLLGTADDDRLWSLDGNFPGGTILDKIGDSITVTADGDPAPTQVEVTHTQQFSAAVMLGDEVLTGKQGEVTWSVTAADGAELDPGTRISKTGLLTVGEDETAAALKITATSKLDNKLVGSCEIGVIGKLNVKVTAATTTVKAGKTLTLKAQLCRGQVPEADQPTEFTWSVSPKARTVAAGTLTVTADENDKSTATLATSRDITTNATVTVTCAECPDAGTLEITIDPPETVTLTVTEDSGKSTVDAGGELNYTATFDDPSSLITEDVTWSVGTSTDVNGSVTGSVTGVEVNNGTVSVADTYVIQDTANGDTIYLKADADDTTTSAKNVVQFTILPPTEVVVTVEGAEAAKVRPGNTLQLIATQKQGDADYASDKVTWTITSTGHKSGTTIDGNGLLKVDASETLGGTIKVKATSVNDSTVSDTLDVNVSNSILIDGRKVIIDNESWIVMTSQGDKTLLMSEYALEQFSGVALTWHDSSAGTREYLNSDWLEKMPELKAHVKSTKIWSSNLGASAENRIHQTDDSVFLLSRADRDGGDSATLTAGARLEWKPGGSWAAVGKGDIGPVPYVGRDFVKRSGISSAYMDGVDVDGNTSSISCFKVPIWLRPLAWVDKSYVDSLLGE